MPSKKYKHDHMSGDLWTRTKRIIIENPVDATPMLKFAEEQVIDGGTGYVKQDIGTINIPMDRDRLFDAFPLIDNITGEPVGTTMTFGEVYSIIYSVYLHFAKQRDQQPIVEGDEEEIV